MTDIRDEARRLYLCVMHDFHDGKEREDMWIKEIELIVSQLLSDEKDRLLEESRKKEARLLEALARMYSQYCEHPYGHDFMGAGESAIELLEEYGVHSEDTAWDEKSEQNLANVIEALKSNNKKGDK